MLWKRFDMIASFCSIHVRHLTDYIVSMCNDLDIVLHIILSGDKESTPSICE